MYADPQTVTINAAAYPLARVGSQNPGRLGVFASSDGNLILAIRQDQTNQRFRREFRLTSRKIATDPISATNKEVSASVIIAIDEPKIGFSDSEIQHILNGLKTHMSDANSLKLLGGEL